VIRACKKMREYANVIIAIDEAEIQNIVASYIGRDDRHKNKFNDIVNVIREGLNNRELFKREKIDDKINNVWAMRFFVGQDNDRIYCQQTTLMVKKPLYYPVYYCTRRQTKTAQGKLQK
jgi:hypothetical protein